MALEAEIFLLGNLILNGWDNEIFFKAQVSKGGLENKKLES